MKRYSLERKESVLKKLLPPQNLSVAELARQEGISDVTLYTWRKQAKTRGEVVPGNRKVPKDWPAEAKLAAVIETATLSEVALSQYCRAIPGGDQGLAAGLPHGAAVRHGPQAGGARAGTGRQAAHPRTGARAPPQGPGAGGGGGAAGAAKKIECPSMGRARPKNPYRGNDNGDS